MIKTVDEPRLRETLVHELHARAARGARVRELVDCIQAELGLPNTAVVPVLTYFCRAFLLPLPVVLPIREWLGTNNDKEIDALILPELVATMGDWAELELKVRADSNGTTAVRTEKTTVK